MVDRVLQAQFVDLTDEQLKDAVGTLHESIKRLVEERKADPELEALRAQLKQIEVNRYTHDIKVKGRLLKAARELARARGITFNFEVNSEQE